MIGPPIVPPNCCRRFGGFADSLAVVDGIVCVEGRVEDVVVAVAVHHVAATFRDGVDESAARLAELGFVSRARYLKFLYHVLAELEGDAGTPNLLREERIVIVAAVHGVVVEVARDAVEADHAEVTVGRRTGR